MPLFARTEQELTSSSLEELANETNITRLTAGSKARSILESVNKRLEEEYDVFDLNLARAYVSSATGQYLDLIGSLLGLDRESPSAASADADLEVIKFYVATGNFSDINGDADIAIPQGTIISTRVNGGGVKYRITSAAVLDKDTALEYISAEAVMPGDESNLGASSLVHHTFTDYSDYLSNTLLVTNIHPIGNGAAFESDENFRFRIANRALEAEAANETAIRLAALSTPGVSDVIVVPRYRGLGTFACIVQSILPTVSQALIDNVAARVELIKAMGDVAFVKGPDETGLSLKLTIHYSDRLETTEIEEIESRIDDSIHAYVGGLDIGETFYINRLISELFVVDNRIANIGEPGKPTDEMYLYKNSRTQDNKKRETLLGDYEPDDYERVILEQSIDSPITLVRAYVRR